MHVLPFRALTGPAAFIPPQAPEKVLDIREPCVYYKNEHKFD